MGRLETLAGIKTNLNERIHAEGERWAISVALSNMHIEAERLQKAIDNYKKRLASGAVSGPISKEEKAFMQKEYEDAVEVANKIERIAKELEDE